MKLAQELDYGTRTKMKTITLKTKLVNNSQILYVGK